jgi:NtrC-family two-component system response regulator AlgB
MPTHTHTQALRALVVDDEKNIRSTLTVCLEGVGCEVAAVGSGSAALAALQRDHFDFAFLDLRLDKENGLDLIPRLLSASPNLDIVVITAYATFDTAVEAVRRGARNYLPKPFSPAQVRHLVEQAVERRKLTWRITDLESRLALEAPEVDLSSEAPAIRSILDSLARAADADATVLFRGESGTGKGIFAHVLHRQSSRRDHPFVTVNCPTLSEELLASELFGHVKGAFTGAVRDQVGRVEAADGGALFLDEIAELSPSLQAKLLRFLQERQFERLGDNHTRRANVRVIAATNRNLEDDVAHGRFREDLLYRLNVLEITVPPLRERREDVLHLARRFLDFFAGKSKRLPLTLSTAAERALLAYPWPGNVRELRNVIERVAILWPAQVIEPAAFPERIRVTVTHDHVEVGGDHSLEQIEREHIERVLDRSATAEQAAKTLGIDASTLWRKRRKFELVPHLDGPSRDPTPNGVPSITGSDPRYQIVASE